MERVELIRELFGWTGEDMPKIGHPSQVVPLLLPWKDKKQEEFLVVCLDGAHRVIGKPKSVTKGLVNRTMIHPRELFRTAIRRNAVAVILAHNHPSGSLVPSAEDREITERLKAAGEIIGISVLDHLIIGKSGYRSMLEYGEV